MFGLRGILATAILVAVSASADDLAPPPFVDEGGRPASTAAQDDNPFESTARRSTAKDSKATATEGIGSTAVIDQQVEQVLIGKIKTELDETKAELAKTKQIIGEVIEGQRLVAESRELPPLQDAEVRVFQLKNTKAAAAAEKVELLFGSQPLRIAVDDASNGLIVFGKAEAIPQVEQLIIKLDELAATGTAEFVDVMVERDVVTERSAARRTLLLRVFWLADGVQDLDSADAYLPASVINSLAKLGLGDPRLVTQTVNSLSVEEGGGPIEFSTNVPAILFEQPVTLTSGGSMSATTDNRAEVDMHLAVDGMGVNCNLKGSLATPLGHFMVLGTANSVIPEYDTTGGGGAGPVGGEMGMAPGAEGGGMPMMGRGGEMGMPGGGFGMAGALPAKYNASRFAFVVQVIEGESFAPDEEGR
jgi:hypothetical protein